MLETVKGTFRIF